MTDLEAKSKILESQQVIQQMKERISRISDTDKETYKGTIENILNVIEMLEKDLNKLEDTLPTFRA